MEVPAVELVVQAAGERDADEVGGEQAGGDEAGLEGVWAAEEV